MPANMLKRLKVKNFKSLLDTEMTLSKNCFFIGMNGVGKTSILQVLDFLSIIARGENFIKQWLDKRGWEKKDLTFYGNKKLLIEIEITFELDGKLYQWDMAFNSNLLKCTSEKISLINTDTKESYEYLIVENGSFSVKKEKKEKISFKYNGSILSALKDEKIGDTLLNIKTFFSSIRSAELLSPTLMKKKARESLDGIGLGGEKLSAFLNGLSNEKKEIIKNKLIDFFPQIQNFETSSLRSGWKKLSLIENYKDNEIITESMHLSDGVLRILAILTQLETTESVLIFDEIEDGINQEFVEKLVDVLVESPHQTTIATHSPIFLNYLDDLKAKESMLFVYKTNNGCTKVKNFFEVIDKYETINDNEYDLFGPGEIMQRVNLVELTNKLRKEIDN